HPLLPTDPRLSRSSATGLAHSQAKRNKAGAGRTVPGGSGLGLECLPGSPPTALAPAMVANPGARAEEGLDAAPAEDVAQGNPLLRLAGIGGGCFAELGRLGYL